MFDLIVQMDAFKENTEQVPSNPLMTKFRSFDIIYLLTRMVIRVKMYIVSVVYLRSIS
jgi:hypothetical protein